jgi:hypothetical protein
MEIWNQRRGRELPPMERRRKIRPIRIYCILSLGPERSEIFQFFLFFQFQNGSPFGVPT